jgi:hypothetical protein
MPHVYRPPGTKKGQPVPLLAGIACQVSLRQKAGGDVLFSAIQRLSLGI